MIYIDKIELHNFQSHKDTVIEFDRGLNVILGNSDSGKTAILRAIKWALYNEPRGDYFIRQGEKNVSVKITFSNGAVVERSKTPSKNAYYLQKPSGEEMRFEGFGTEVPKEIVEITNMYKTVLDSSNTKTILNISEQLDGPFLLNEQPSVRASAIGRLIGVNYIDDALREVVRDNKRINQDIDLLNKQKEGYKEKLKSFEYIKDYKDSYSKILNIRNEISKLSDKLDKLKNLNDRYKENRDNISKTEVLHNNLKSIDEVEKLYSNLENKSLKFLNISNIFNRFNKINIGLNSVNYTLKSLQNLNTLEDKIKSAETLNHKLINYKRLSNNFITNENLLKRNEDVLKNYRNLNEIENKLNNISLKIEVFNKNLNLNNSIKKVNSSLKIGYDYLEKFKNNEKIEMNLNKINSLSSRLDLVKRINDNILKLENDYKETRNMHKDINIKIKSLSNKYEDLIIKKGICPFCYSEINNESLEHIKYHLRND
ncbi:AAA family ATPase [Peptoniphilus sp. MSJ-1]|uniref:AAA family ATPase n=1 Tax=Peptoniphilus ovalis TaxID=2841503 RepID=A0ABS6FI03_9FIRM|nr:AAA family ATPase [Peptoniphilus ovalis]MBU5669058.1 AAA family ATPase [Peptoniphilus ovalis]